MTTAAPVHGLVGEVLAGLEAYRVELDCMLAWAEEGHAPTREEERKLKRKADDACAEVVLYLRGLEGEHLARWTARLAVLRICGPTVVTAWIEELRAAVPARDTVPEEVAGG